MILHYVTWSLIKTLYQESDLASGKDFDKDTGYTMSSVEGVEKKYIRFSLVLQGAGPWENTIVGKIIILSILIECQQCCTP